MILICKQNINVFLQFRNNVRSNIGLLSNYQWKKRTIYYLLIMIAFFLFICNRIAKNVHIIDYCTKAFAFVIIVAKPAGKETKIEHFINGR